MTYKMIEPYDIYYDKESDFLEVFFVDPTECYADEPEKGVFVRKDEHTNEIKSIGIISFSKRGALLNELFNRFNLVFPIDFSINN